jgi:hypothetical protein
MSFRPERTSCSARASSNGRLKFVHRLVDSEQLVGHVGREVPVGEVRTELRLPFFLPVRDHDAPGQGIALTRDPHLQVCLLPPEQHVVGGDACDGLGPDPAGGATEGRHRFRDVGGEQLA